MLSRALRRRIDGPAARTIDVGGLVVAPGFIDLHTHAIRGIFQVPTADNYVRQGVTTIMEGPDGSPRRAAEAVSRQARGIAEVAQYRQLYGTGFGACSGGRIGEPPGYCRRNLEACAGLVRDGMRDGAFGLSTGLFYVPGNFTPIEEVIELQKIVAPFRGVHTSHMRDEASRVLDSVKETIAIGEQGGVPTQISHHKVIGKADWGKKRRDVEAGRRGACARRGRDDRSVSVHRVEHEHRFGADAGMGAGRRPCGDPASA